MLDTLNEVVKVIFYLLGTNGFRVKVKNERFTAAFLKKNSFSPFIQIQKSQWSMVSPLFK